MRGGVAAEVHKLQLRCTKAARRLQFREPRNQPISRNQPIESPQAGTPMTESATGMMPAVMGDEAPG
eukprot:SAG25_NODE_2773_length_1391_cov_1.316563_4_plen_66_part_01